MYEWWKNKAWPALKKFFKKYGGYIIAFVLGIAAYLGYDTSRGKRIDGDIQRLKSSLDEYRRLNDELNRRAEELEKRLAELDEQSRRALLENSDLRREVAAARDDAAKLEYDLKRALTSADAAEELTGELSEQSARAREYLERLRKLVESATTST